MSLTGPEANESVAIDATATKNCNQYHATHVTITKDPNDPAAIRMSVTVVRGYDDAGTFVQTEKVGTFGFDATQVAADMQASVTAGDSLELSFKKGLWSCLQAHAGIPAGTIG